MANLTGLIVSKQTGALFPPLFNTATEPYVQSPYGINWISFGTYTFNMNPGCMWPIVWSGLTNTSLTSGYPNGKFLKRFNAAVLGVSAPTLYQTGNQLSGPGNPGFENSQFAAFAYAPCFDANIIGYSLAANLPVELYWDALPFNVGNVDNPLPNAVSPVNWSKLPPTNSLGSSGDLGFTFMSNIGGTRRFTQMYLDPTTNLNVIGWGPSGFIQKGPIDKISQIPNWGNLIVAAGYYPGIGNVFLINPSSVTTINDIVLVICDQDFNITNSFIVKLDSVNYNTAFETANQGTSLFYAQATTGGFLITFNGQAGFTAYGKTRNYGQFLLSPRGDYWAPIVCNPVTTLAQTAATFTSWGGGQHQWFHIDPNGIYWYAISQGGDIYVNNSFGVNIGSIITPPWQNINLPQIDLSCYTPCDPVQMYP